MEIIVKNADFSACGIGLSISPAVTEMMAKYTNYKDDEQALTAMQKFYGRVGAGTLSKCTVIVPCLAADVVEAMKDLVTDTDVRDTEFDVSYFNIVQGKGLVGAQSSTADTIKYRRISAVNKTETEVAGHLKMVAFTDVNIYNSKYIVSASDGGYIESLKIDLNANGSQSVNGLSEEGLTFDAYGFKGFDSSKGIVGVLESKLQNTKYTIFDWANSYSTLRTVDGSSPHLYTTCYLCQGYNQGTNNITPICMFVWGIGITDDEALTIRDAMYQFKTDMGIE